MLSRPQARGLLPSGALMRTRYIEDSKKKDEEKDDYLARVCAQLQAPVPTRGVLPSGALDAHPTKFFGLQDHARGLDSA